MHTHTRHCPVTCLKPMLSPVAYGLLRSECALVGGDEEPGVGHAVHLYERGQLATVRYIGPVRHKEIESCLASIGVIGSTADPASQTPEGGGQPPPPPAGWSGTARRMRTCLFVE